jgi:glyoxylase-like metal-dependent hydrolase (beta-lactamase superfamily II)
VGVALDYKVFRHSYLGFSSNSILVFGENDAILIDSSQLLSDSYRLVPELIAMKKRITHIYVSHFHPDHHFGLEVLQFAFPHAKIVALPSVVKDMVFTSRDKLEMWDIDWLGRDIPLRTTIPMPLAQARLEVEGEEVLLFDDWHGDSVNNSVVWIPSIRVLCATDVAFHDAHLFTIESNVERRRLWRKDIERLMDFDPRVIIPAHCGEEQMRIIEALREDKSGTYTGCVDWSLKYMDVYEDAYNTAKTGAEMVAMMFKHYGDVKPVDYAVHWQTRLLFPKTSPDWLVPLPGEPGEIFLNPDGGFDGDPPKE